MTFWKSLSGSVVVEFTSAAPEEELDLMAAAYQMEKDQIREMLGQNMIYVVNDVRNKLAVNFMFDNAVIK